METGAQTEPLGLPDLVPLPRWQRLQDHFASVLSIPIRTVSCSQQLLIDPSWPNSMDAERTIRWLKVGEELPKLLPPDDLPAATASLTTAVGITYSAVPIRCTSDRILAYFMVGPVVVGTREEELQFRKRMTSMGLDAQAMWSVMLSLKLYTFAGMRSALNLMEEVGTSIAQLSYQTKQLSKLVPETARVSQAVVTYHTDRILHSLLEAATVATKADGGSVMLFDTRAQHLRIKTAQGLSNEVAARTQLQRGEGLAGLALAQREPLLLDTQTRDERLRGLMHRPELVSSLVMPIALQAGSEPIGVLNLRTTNPERRFTNDHVELLRRLLDLASIALGSSSLLATPPPSSSS